MKFNLVKQTLNPTALVIACFSMENDNKTKAKDSNKQKFNCQSKSFVSMNDYAWGKNFSAQRNEIIVYPTKNNQIQILLGLGNKKLVTNEVIRRAFGALVKQLRNKKLPEITIDLDSFGDKKNLPSILQSMQEAAILANYEFNKYKSSKKDSTLTSFLFISKNVSPAVANKIFSSTNNVCQSINLIRDYINECPGVLNSEVYAQLVSQDAKKLPNVKVKVLNKKEIIAEKMNMFLSVNAGSAFEPRLVHLTYTPSKKSKKTKHVVLVGKGITYDTGGYSLKPATSMAGMKNDMGGSATVYGAFRAAVLNKSSHKISCLLVITDNKINSMATVPDTVVEARNKKTVEILNTDAEGRLILGDALDYACDLEPNAIIDVATLTGACLVALGKEVCGLMGNNEKLNEQIKKSAQISDEYMWQLPLIQEYRDDIKSKVADIKNIGSPMRAGTAIGAVFLENFIKNNIPWAHLDIAGVCDDQNHLPYCPGHGASGLIVRTLHTYLMNE